MSGTNIEANLKKLGIELPDAPSPAANYVPFVKVGQMVTVSGQLPIKDGSVQHKGILGKDTSVEEGVEAARLCAINLLSQVKAAAEGDLSRVVKVIRLGGFVASAPDFEHQPAVVNGASDLMVEVFGDMVGAHARAAVGVAALPLGASVEVEGSFLLKE